MFTIRHARVNDALEIARIKHAVWSDDTVNTALIASVIRSSDHVTLLAEYRSSDDERQVVGFVDGFMTYSGDGHQPRWELDLLAIDPEFHGRGLAKQLIAAYTAAGWERGAALTRALVQVDNIACQRALAHCGYRRVSADSELYVAAGGAVLEAQLPRDIHRIPVKTFSYCGIWLEGNLSAKGIAAANTERLLDRMDLAGMVIPRTDQAALRAADAAGFEHVGSYHYWQQLNPDAAPAPC